MGAGARGWLRPGRQTTWNSALEDREERKEGEEVCSRRNNSLWEILKGRVHGEVGRWAENEAWRDERWAWRTRAGRELAALRSLFIKFKRLYEHIVQKAIGSHHIFFLILLLFK